MIQIRKAGDRGAFDHGWLDTRHTFSFAGYYDPAQRGFRSLRVMNEDRVAPGQGFGTHGHRDMEIVSYVLDGALEHRDSMGNGSVLRRGMFQRMTAGTGVEHSEFNHSSAEPVHFYQIWLLPERAGLAPGYEEMALTNGSADNRLKLVAAHAPHDGALKIHQDAAIYLGRLDADTRVSHELAADRHAWLQVLRGEVELNGQPLAAGDGAAIAEETNLEIAAATEAEVLLFDLA